MKELLQERLAERIEGFVNGKREIQPSCSKFAQKKELFHRREAEVVKLKGKGKIKGYLQDKTRVYYVVHLEYLVRQGEQYYIEEEVEERVASFYQGKLQRDEELKPHYSSITIEEEDSGQQRVGYERITYQYDRLKAVQYAEKWWNSYNPAYKSFDVDCTNFISQCLRAGGAPMRGMPSRGKGWWMSGNNWSYSWSVANALKVYLGSSIVGLRAKTVSSAEQLTYGDVICYDFEGDGRYNHNTIVTGFDAVGMPLVNAHTTNSRMRYWSYEDSTAYTPNIQYKFFSIQDDR
ncbi:hypothetical protein Q73_02395 [Bacillus coahuilensis m2-6]|uniref:Putative amidase domain-containing protein n=1 Tax=Bacillus coahuilensis p1.1.43 TaxID=1150625 RepID=A0A147KBD7_9BACI|nr:amidase domain-containing protein [Bacillus coahuilensis]KUP08479.1 hypothetical protein Q75_02745 [Bacillus coahuilensis p1.1.43]KUP09602.1 hypothetical protein Q73_02395 [Bacillus coahuilensis m2-6]